MHFFTTVAAFFGDKHEGPTCQFHEKHPARVCRYDACASEHACAQVLSRVCLTFHCKGFHECFTDISIVSIRSMRETRWTCTRKHKSAFLGAGQRGA